MDGQKPLRKQGGGQSPDASGEVVGGAGKSFLFLKKSWIRKMPLAFLSHEEMRHLLLVRGELSSSFMVDEI